MAWTAIETFEAGTVGADVAGTSGGSGWSAAWAETGAGQLFDFSTSSPAFGSKCAVAAFAGAQGELSRTFTAITEGTFYYSMRVSNTTSNCQMRLQDGANLKLFIRFGATGNITAFGSSGTDIQTYLANTWYRLGVAFDCGTDTFTVSVDNGTPSSAIAFNATASQVTRLMFEEPANQTVTFSIDDIADTYIPPVTSTAVPTPTLSLLHVG